MLQYRHSLLFLLPFTMHFPSLSLLLLCCFFSFHFSPTPSHSLFQPSPLPSPKSTFLGRRVRSSDRPAFDSGTCTHTGALSAGALITPTRTPHSGYQLRHRARSRPIGCLSWWQTWGQEMLAHLCQTSCLSPVCVNWLCPVCQENKDDMRNLKSQNPKDKVLAAASGRIPLFIW